MNDIISDPSIVVLDNTVTLTPRVVIRNETLNNYYLWQRRDPGETEWKSLYKKTNKTLSFVATGKDYQTEFRCKVFIELGDEIITSAFTLNFEAFVDLVQDLPEKIIFPENSQQEHVLNPAVVSTHLSTVSYQWQKSLDEGTTWNDISGSTDKKLVITPSLARDLNSSNDTNHYSLRLKIFFGQTSTVSYSNSVYIDLKDAINLFGINACLTQEQVEELAITDATSPNPSPDAHGNSLLPNRTYIEEINTSPIDPVDKCKDKNTCGISIKELFDTYPIYNTQKGLYKSWGDIEFPWQLEESRLRDLTPKPLPTSWDSLLWDSPGTTCNLNANVEYTTEPGQNPPSDPGSSTHPEDYVVKSNYSSTSETNDKWQIAQYKALYAYFPKIGSGGLSSPADATCLTERPADRVLRIEDDGYRVSLYEANQLVTALSGPFDPVKWNKICHIITSIPAGLPTPDEIRERYAQYKLDFFLDKWSEYNADWSEDFYQQSFDACRSTNSTLADIEKCLKPKLGPFGESNDQWKDARIKKVNFYERGDYAWFEGPCGDTVCLYICLVNIPATKENYNKHINFSKEVDGVEYWQRVYCVVTGANKCLEPQRNRDLPNYQLVEIGSLGHYVEQPIPYFDLQGNKLCADYELLNDFLEEQPPKVLTQEEIDALDQP